MGGCHGPIMWFSFVFTYMQKRMIKKNSFSWRKAVSQYHRWFSTLSVSELSDINIICVTMFEYFKLDDREGGRGGVVSSNFVFAGHEDKVRWNLWSYGHIISSSLDLQS